MSSYPYSYTHTYTYTPFFSLILPILALIVIIAGGLALYFLFVRKPNRFQGAAAKLHDALNFRTFYTEKIIRALYCITVVAIAVYSVILLFTHFFTALMLFVLGNLIARIVYEYALLLVLCRNTQEINRKMGPLPAEPPVPPAPGAGPAPGAAPQQPPVPPVNPQQPCPPQNAAPVPPQAPQQPPMPPQDGPQA